MVRLVLELKRTPVAGTPAMVTVAPCTKFCPVSVTVAFPVFKAVVGVAETTMGGAMEARSGSGAVAKSGWSWLLVVWLSQLAA